MIHRIFRRLGAQFLWAGLVLAALVGIASAGVLIEQLGAAATPGDSDLVPTVQGSSPAKGQSLGAIAAYMAARSETLTNKTINCVSGNTCTLPSSGGGTSFRVQGIRTGNQTLVNTDAGTLIPNSSASMNWTLPPNAGGSVFPVGTQFVLQSLGTDVDNIATSAPSTIYGAPTSGTTSSWLPAGDAVLITVDSSGNYFMTLMAGAIPALHSSSATSDTFSAFHCLFTLYKTAGTTVTETIPTGLPVGCHIEVVQGGAGEILFQAGSGFTLTSPHGYTHSFAQGSTIGVLITTATSGVFYGDGA